MDDDIAEDIVAMGRLAREAMEAGAIGFTTSRTKNHRTSTGEYTPTLTAAADELAGIAAALGDLGVHRVTAVAVPGDEVRATAYAAAGLQREGTLRSRSLPDGTRGDLDLWAVLADDPRPAADLTL